jgi:hypothetical protein
VELKRLEREDEFPFQCVGVFYVKQLNLNICGTAVGPAHILTSWREIK